MSVGHQAVEHGEDERAYLVAVHVGVGADDDLVPAQIVDVEVRQILGVLVPPPRRSRGP
jgi:hypothetical protein